MARDWFRGVGLATVLAASVTAYGQGAPSKGQGAPAGAPAGTGSAAVTDAYDEAAKHYDAGRAALAKNKYEQAIDELKAARQLFPATAQDEIALSLGLLADAEFRAKRYRDAAQRSEEMLRLFGAKLDPPDRKQIEGNLATAKKNVATLKVTVVPPPGSAAGWDAALELLVDKKPFGSKGPLPPEIYVEEGARTLVVRAGEARDEVSGEYKKGTESSVTLTLKAPVVNVAPTATASVAPTGAIPTSSGPQKGLLITGGLLTGAAAVAGVVTLGVFFGKSGEFQRKTGDRSCVEDECFRLLDDMNLLGRTSMWLLIGAGALGAGTILYWKLAPQNGVTGSSELRVKAGVGANVGRLIVEGSW